MCKAVHADIDVSNKDIVEQLKSIENDPNGLFKLSEILKPSKYSAEELRNKYLSEKYGI